MATHNSIEEMLNRVLGPYGVEVHFGKQAVKDFAGHQKEQQEDIATLIIVRGRKGPLIKPNGIGAPLRNKLAGFTKIKPKYLSVRIVYRPVAGHPILMDIIAIGPRDKGRVYGMAASRLSAFNDEMRQLHQTPGED